MAAEGAAVLEDGVAEGKAVFGVDAVPADEGVLEGAVTPEEAILVGVEDAPEEVAFVAGLVVFEEAVVPDDAVF